ncbi:hypothetical protein A9404_02445 [Halothiobacillus diazotrophicus]|uniref:cysteine-S-conjugate beta-lyase n=1 Tax=Halothiobacillus diazotrophicus TaxID=1860122 RepID=A0A191ZEU1_9GAMM|nr:PatB family C-S lyase [Halothiobacillus diazotrophicus]ANJ66389.1 hypothetical protein A9404_02445 [Halothiobacillus diazotrophicus]
MTGPSESGSAPIDFDHPIDRAGSDCVKFDARAAVFGKSDVQPLWVADMDFPAPACVQDALRARAAHPIYGYTVYPPAFYAAIAGWLARRHDWVVDVASIVALPGVVPAMNLIVGALSEPDDAILVQTPVYPPIHQLAGNQNRLALESALVWTDQGYEIDWSDLETKLAQARLFVLCAPHNPVGRVWRRDELARMAELCVRYDVWILADEIHADLVHAPHRHVPIASLSPEIAERCITLHAPSKTFNVAGLNTSFAIVENTDLRARLTSALNRSGLTSGNVFGITALIAAYSNGEPWLEQLLRQLQRNIDFVVDFIERHIPAIRVQRPEATFLLWLDCRELCRTFRLDDRALNRFFIEQAGLGLNAGISFGAPGSGFMRLNIACPQPQLATAMRALQAAVANLSFRSHSTC